MKKVVTNPYLPNFEYIPDGEPHVFNGRVYVYGSHDRFGGNNFCMNDYVTWSAQLMIYPIGVMKALFGEKKTTQQPMAKRVFMLQMFAKVQMVNFIYTIAQFKVSRSGSFVILCRC